MARDSTEIARSESTSDNREHRKVIAMRYMMLVYTQETEMEKASPEDMAKVFAGHVALQQDTKRRGIFRAADPLKYTSSATTVRVREGKTLVTDGPFAETKEQLAGYYILDCANLDEALEWAARIPTSCGGASGCIEVRPIHEFAKGPEGEPILSRRGRARSESTTG